MTLNIKIIPYMFRWYSESQISPRFTVRLAIVKIFAFGHNVKFFKTFLLNFKNFKFQNLIYMDYQRERL